MELGELSSSSSLPLVVWPLAVVDLLSAVELVLEDEPVLGVLLVGVVVELLLEGLAAVLLPAGVLEAAVEGALEVVPALLAGALLAAGLGAGVGFGALAPEEPPILPVLNLRYLRP